MAIWKSIENPLFMFDNGDTFAEFHANYCIANVPRELYHYTNCNSLLAIINSQYIHATEISFLNDPQEYKWGFDLLNKVLRKRTRTHYNTSFVKAIKDSFNSNSRHNFLLFTFSLSENPDVLSQWRAYGNNGEGYSIGFNGDVIKDRAGFGEIALHDIDIDAMPAGYVYTFHLLPVIYDSSKQNAVMNNLLDSAYAYWKKLSCDSDKMAISLFSMVFQHRIKEILLTVKNPGYNEEKEWRIISTIHHESDNIQFRCGQSGVTPYVKINISPRECLPKCKLPITSIWIGPAEQQALSHCGVKMLLKNRRMNVATYTSKIKYRSW